MNCTCRVIQAKFVGQSMGAATLAHFSIRLHLVPGLDVRALLDEELERGWLIVQYRDV
jgi:hypothetical protein